LSKQSSKKNKNQKKNNPVSGAKTSKTTLFFLGFLLILVGVFGVLYNPLNSEKASWKVSEGGILSFSQRGKPVFTVQDIEDVYVQDDNQTPENLQVSENGSLAADSLKLLTFESEGDEVQALLRIPANSSSVPGIVLLPGAGVSKESEQGLAVKLSKLGYATLTLDQRNRGSIDFKGDLELFKAGLEPLEYKMTYDALKAADVLSAQPKINSEKLAIIGESNGGRFAIIACALDPSLKGVIGISTSGYGTSEIDLSKVVVDPEVYRFYRSVDPESYLSLLPPAKLVLLHSFNDTVISHESAVRTFALAEEPKAMYNVTEATHGYTTSMYPYLEEELRLILS
jgi:fermentation-respiration switch protein FrsA (DUF1100 family)